MLLSQNKAMPKNKEKRFALIEQQIALSSKVMEAIKHLAGKKKNGEPVYTIEGLEVHVSGNDMVEGNDFEIKITGKIEEKNV